MVLYIEIERILLVKIYETVTNGYFHSKKKKKTEERKNIIETGLYRYIRLHKAIFFRY